MDRFVRLPASNSGMSLGMKPHTSHPHAALSVSRSALLIASVGLGAAVLLAACSRSDAPTNGNRSDVPGAGATSQVMPSTATGGFANAKLSYPTAPSGDVVD